MEIKKDQYTLIEQSNTLIKQSDRFLKEIVPSQQVESRDTSLIPSSYSADENTDWFVNHPLNGMLQITITTEAVVLNCAAQWKSIMVVQELYQY